MTSNTPTLTPADEWFAFGEGASADSVRIAYQEHHLGNPLIRSIHGGVVGSLIEETAIRALHQALREKSRDAELELVTSVIDYLRVTKDADLLARASIVRIARRVAFMDVLCWQDSEDLPVARGTCTIRILDDS